MRVHSPPTMVIGAKLTNCYAPAALPHAASHQDENQSNDITITVDIHKRDDGNGKTRSARCLRRILLQSNIIPSIAGSSHVEIGHTKIICKVLGPLTAGSPHIPSGVSINMDQGVLHWDVRYAAHVGIPVSSLLTASVSSVDQSDPYISMGKVNSWISARETDLAARLSSAMEAAIPLKQYPKTVLVVQITILQDDGSVLPACISAASLALADAVVEMYDLVTACTVARVQEELLVDPTTEEMQQADALVTIAQLPNWKEVTLWEQSGRLTPEQTNQAMDLCRQGSHTLHKFLREHLVDRKL